MIILFDYARSKSSSSRAQNSKAGKDAVNSEASQEDKDGATAAPKAKSSQNVLDSDSDDDLPNASRRFDYVI